MIVLNGMLIVVESNIIPDNILANPDEQPAPEIWLDPDLSEQ